jgi:hypothetical protein
MCKESPGRATAARRRDAEAYAMHALAANGFGDAVVEAVERPKSSGARLPLDARIPQGPAFDRGELPPIAARRARDADRAPAHAVQNLRRSFE